MRLTDLIVPRRIKIPLKASTRRKAIAELVDLLAADGVLTSPADVLTAVLGREDRRSTGIGNGVALPHGKTDAARSLVAAAGRTRRPIDFDSPDGRGVRLIVLVVGPKADAGPHIQALARISRLLEPEATRAALLAAGTPEQFHEVLSRHENAEAALHAIE